MTACMTEVHVVWDKATELAGDILEEIQAEMGSL